MQKVEFKKIPQLDFRTNEAFKTLREPTSHSAATTRG